MTTNPNRPARDLRTLTVAFKKSEFETLKERAAKEERAMGSIIRRALALYLKTVPLDSVESNFLSKPNSQPTTNKPLTIFDPNRPKPKSQNPALALA